jgi:hypothetical protein
MINRRQAEKEVWDVIKPLLDLPPTTVNNEQSNEGMRQYMNARRIISESVKDPLFVKKIQERKATLREMLTHDFSPEVFDKLFNSDIRALVPDKRKKK